MNLRRILVALDASPQSIAALEAAAGMAAEAEAELLGLFVEDINLLRLAGFPFAREFGRFSALTRELDTPSMELALRNVAQRARTAIESVAERERLTWSFRVARGPVVSELLAAAAEADLVALGASGREGGMRSGLGSTALSVLKNAPGAVLILHAGGSLRGPAVVLICEGTLDSPGILAKTAGMARACGNQLVALLLAGDEESARQLQERVAPILEPEKLDIRYRSVAGAGPARLVETVRGEQPGALLLSESAPPLIGDKTFEQLVASVNCPIFVMR